MASHGRSACACCWGRPRDTGILYGALPIHVGVDPQDLYHSTLAAGRVVNATMVKLIRAIAVAVARDSSTVT